MSIEKSQIQAVANLARLAINKSELEATTGIINQILDMVNEMETVNTENIEPMAHPLGVEQRLRADKIAESNQREQLQKGAPAIERGLFLVPKVIE